MSYFKIKSHAKINLSLNVIGKSKSLHKIESIISFLTLHDEIKIRKIDNRNHKIKFIGKFSKGIKSKNTVSKLLENIDKRKLLKNKYQIIIKKNIPSKAGLGGGSMNAASLINFFIKKRLIRANNEEILKISNSVGSDVALGLNLKNLLFKTNNTIKKLSNKKKFFVLIVKPYFGCSTKKIYSKVRKFSNRESNLNSNNIFSMKLLKKSKNDLEIVVLKEYPKLKSLKIFLENLTTIEFARMTGSGSAIIAYFSSLRKCKEAREKVKKQFRNYWCKISKTI